MNDMKELTNIMVNPEMEIIDKDTEFDVLEFYDVTIPNGITVKANRVLCHGNIILEGTLKVKGLIHTGGHIVGNGDLIIKPTSLSMTITDSSGDGLSLVKVAKTESYKTQHSSRIINYVLGRNK